MSLVGAAAGRGLYRYPLCGYDSSAATNAAKSGRDEVRFQFELRPRAWVTAIDAGGPITVLAGVHVGCFELFANEGIRSIADLKGKSVGVRAGSSEHLFVSSWRLMSGSTRPTTSRWVTSNPPSRWNCSCKARSMHSWRFRPMPQDLRRAQDRPRGRQHRRGPPLVAIFLLHAGGQPELCRTISGRDQARAARHSEGRRSVRQRARAAPRG